MQSSEPKPCPWIGAAISYLCGVSCDYHTVLYLDGTPNACTNGRSSRDSKSSSKDQGKGSRGKEVQVDQYSVIVLTLTIVTVDRRHRNPLFNCVLLGLVEILEFKKMLTVTNIDTTSVRSFCSEGLAFGLVLTR